MTEQDKYQITLRNEFHGTETAVNVILVNEHGTPIITRHQERRAKRTLCGVDGCTCSGPAGVRDGGTIVEEETWDNQTGEGATFAVYVWEGA